MDPDELSDEQLIRLLTLAISAVSGISSTVGGLISTAETLAAYIETGERPS